MNSGKPESHRRMAPFGTIGLAVLLVALLAYIAWGYLGGERREKPASGALVPVVTVPVAPPAPVPASAAAPMTSAMPAAPSGVAVSAATPVAAPGDAKPNENPPASNGVRGVVKAKDEVLFSAKIAARIARMPYKEGQRFDRGSVLVDFDCSRLRAEANAAWAANRASRQIHKQSLELDAHNAIGKSEVKIAQAKSEQTGAEATAIETQVRDCTIMAPFSGIVVEAMAHEHETAAPGAQLMRVLNDSQLEVHLIAPSTWLTWLKQGSAFQFKVDETGRTHAGQVARLGAAVDPVSQTVRVVGVFTGSRETVLPGMSGTAEFARPDAARRTP